ncbi:MAG: BolA/IbaG family iron-sulfur metabolism protein [Halothiobacillaceae bacterium]|nr:MAG: BolA/IbaG family iron-sulfur metabolism protein [Halothiobacillaceae bacterium]
MPMNPNALIQLIQAAIPDAQVTPSGEGCSFNLTVVSASFAGEPLIRRHRRVMAPLNDLIASGALHAVTIKAHTPEESRG